MTDVASEVHDAREQRGLSLLKEKAAKIRKVFADRYIVPSQWKAGSYLVDTSEGSCTCPDFEETSLKCKHQWAVEHYLLQTAQKQDISVPKKNAEAPSQTKQPEEKRPTYPQNWKAYRKSRTMEGEVFRRYLHMLCSAIPTGYSGRGRPSFEQKDAIYASIMKGFINCSADRLASDLRTCRDQGLMEAVPSSSTLLRTLQDPATSEILRQLLAETTVPFRSIETTFAVDATGIGSRAYLRWFAQKYPDKRARGEEVPDVVAGDQKEPVDGEERPKTSGSNDGKRKKWLKLHILCGVSTLIIGAAEVTHHNVHDSVMFPNLIESALERFEKVSVVTADKAYPSRKHFDLAARKQLTLLAPFKAGAVLNGHREWDKALAYFRDHQEEFGKLYHQRSNSESTFSSMKRVLGGHTRGKTDQAQMNEILIKAICHNLRVLIRATFEIGVKPAFWDASSTSDDGKTEVDLSKWVTGDDYGDDE